LLVWTVPLKYMANTSWATSSATCCSTCVAICGQCESTITQQLDNMAANHLVSDTSYTKDTQDKKWPRWSQRHSVNVLATHIISDKSMQILPYQKQQKSTSSSKVSNPAGFSIQLDIVIGCFNGQVLQLMNCTGTDSQIHDNTQNT